MAKNSVRIRLKAYENRSLDAASEKIVKTATSHGAKKIVGPVPLPTEREVVTILSIRTLVNSSRSVHTRD